MTRDQKRLLLYLETCAVDHSGLVVPAHMNGADFAQANEWDDLGFLAFQMLARDSLGSSLWRGMERGPQIAPGTRAAIGA